MELFNYDVDKFMYQIFGEDKIDVYSEDEVVLEAERHESSVWTITSRILENGVININKSIADKIIDAIHKEARDNLPVVLMPNHFLIIDDSNLN